MRRLVLFILAAVCGYLANAQDKYIYDKYGELQYSISDSLSIKEKISDFSLIIEHRDTALFIFDGKRCGYKESTTYVVKDGQATFYEKSYTPVLFGRTAKLSSLHSFLTYLRYAESKYPGSNFKINYDYTDPQIGLTAGVYYEYAFKQWRFVLDENIYKMSNLKELIPLMEELINTCKELQ
jgi:hypothetical protein